MRAHLGASNMASLSACSFRTLLAPADVARANHECRRERQDTTWEIIRTNVPDQGKFVFVAAVLLAAAKSEGHKGKASRNALGGALLGCLNTRTWVNETAVYANRITNSPALTSQQVLARRIQGKTSAMFQG